MRNWMIGSFLLLILVLATSCTQQATIQCNAPYNLINNVCCLDANKNNVCDDQETQKPHEQPVPPPPPAVVINPPQEQPKIEPAKEQPKETVKQPETTQTAPAVDSVDNLIAKMNNLKSVSYVYEGKQTAMMGHAMRVQLTKFFKANDHPVNTIYINLDTKKGKAYCEGEQRLVQQICDKDALGPFDVDGSKYYSKSPLDWLQEFRQVTPTSVDADAQVIQSIHTDRWIMSKNGLVYTFWVDSAHGMPMRIRITTSGNDTSPQYVDYMEVYFNTVKPEVFQGKI